MFNEETVREICEAMKQRWEVRLTKEIMRELYGTKEQRMKVAQDSETPFVALLMIAIEDEDDKVAKEAVMNLAVPSRDWQRFFIPREASSTSQFVWFVSRISPWECMSEYLSSTFEVRWQVAFEPEMRMKSFESSYFFFVFEEITRMSMVDERNRRNNYDSWRYLFEYRKTELVTPTGVKYYEKRQEREIRLEKVERWISEKYFNEIKDKKDVEKRKEVEDGSGSCGGKVES